MKIHTIVIHYSATYPDQDMTRDDIDRMHKRRGFREIGYHWFIRRDGTLEEGRPEGTLGAHVRGHNSGTIGICFAGGLERATGPDLGVWNPTQEQEETMLRLIADIQKRWPSAKKVVGHRNLGATQCPGRDDVAEWWAANGANAPRKITESRTIRGGAMAGAGTIGTALAEQAETIAPLTEMSDVIKWAFIALTMAGVALTVYARWDDWQAGKR